MDQRIRGSIIDKLLIAFSILYVTLPITIFFGGYLNHYLAAVLALVFTFFACTLYEEFSPVSIINRETAKFWLIVAACLALWVFLSGIGGVVYQNMDLTARNVFYRDLCDYDWPVIYDNSLQSAPVRELVGEGQTLLSYYFSWWLFPAFISKIFELGEPARNFLLSSWAFLGVFLITYNLCRYFKRTSYIIPVIFIFFSGLDVIGAVINWKSIYHIFVILIEPWSNYFAYTCNTHLLWWTFNQSLPTWIITILLLQLHNSKHQLALSSLIFAYSPWAAVGIIPIAFTAAIVNNKKFSSVFSVQNILVPLSMMVVYGSFYLFSNAANTYKGGFTITNIHVLIIYLQFILLEFGIYFIIMGRVAAKYKFYYVTLIELILIPCYRLFTGDFIFRASVPALFILMTFLMKFFLDDNKGIRRTILITAMLIGAWTPINEFNRMAAFTSINILDRYGLLPAKMQSMQINNKSIVRPLRREEIYSLGSIRTTDKNMIKSYRDHFLASGYEDSFFFKYLAK